MYNKATLIGNIGKDPECRKVADINCCTFSLATSESYKDKNGEWQTKTEWHNIVVWRNTADYVEKNIKKGMQVLVEGKIRTRSWQDQSTQKTMYTTEIVADLVRVLEKKEKSDNQTPPPPVEDGDLPF